MLELDAWLEIAKSAALKGGKYLLENQGQELKILLNEGRDIKLQLDTDTEKLIKDSLGSQSEFSILGEKQGLVMIWANFIGWLILLMVPQIS